MKIKLLALVGLCAGAVALGGNALAGSENTTAVVAISGNNMVGALGLALNTANNVEYIGCWTNGNGVASCSARTAAGVGASCTTATAAHLLTIRSLNGDSYLSVSFNNAGDCTSMSVWNRSDFPTKYE